MSFGVKIVCVYVNWRLVCQIAPVHSWVIRGCFCPSLRRRAETVTLNAISVFILFRHAAAPRANGFCGAIHCGKETAHNRQTNH